MFWALSTEPKGSVGALAPYPRDRLAAVGLATKALFSDFELRPGKTRGVDDKIALRLSPPPLPAWVTWSGLGLTAAGAVTTAVAGTVNLLAYQNGQAALSSAQGAISAAELKQHSEQVQASFTVLVAAGTATVVVGALSAVSAAWLTDWDDLQSELE